MNGFQQKKPNSGYDASSNNAKDRNSYVVNDIKRINMLIQQIEGRNLSHDQMEKLLLLLSSLKKISAHNPQIDNQKINLSPQKNSCNTREEELNNIKQTVDYLRENLYNTQSQNQTSVQTRDSQDISQKQVTDNAVLNSQEESQPDHGTLNQSNYLGIFHHDIANLAKSVSELCSIVSLSGVQGSSSNLDKMLSKMDTLAKECSVRNIENNWQVVEKQFKELDFKNLHQQINSFSSKLDAVKCDLDKKNIVFNGTNPDEKVLSIFNNTNSLLSLLQALSERLSTKKVYAIDVKLSEIKAAIAKNERVVESCTNNFTRIFEERFKTIEKQIQNIQKDVIYQKKPAENSLQSLAILDKRIKKLAEEPSIAKSGELLTEISNKIDSIAQIADNQGISKKLDSILQNIDHVTKYNQFDLKKSFQFLEDNFKNISLKLEKKQQNPENNTLLQNLKKQIAGVKELVTNQIDNNNLSTTAKNQIGNWENYIVETAQKTAKSILNSLDKPQNMDQVFTDKFNECFEKLQKIQAEQMIKNFTALYEMLAKISKKLDKSLNKSEVQSINKNNSTPIESHTSTSLRNDSQNKSDISLQLKEMNASFQNKKELDISKNKNEKSSLFSSSDILNVKYDQLDDSTEENDEPIEDTKLREIEENIPHNIQQILDRVSSIQNGLREEYNTIPDYISAARRAASSSIMGNDIIQKNQRDNSTKQIWSFTRNYSFKRWFEATIIIAILIASSFLISPYMLEKNFLGNLEFEYGDFID